MNKKKAFARKLITIAMTVLLTLNTSPLSICASTMASAMASAQTGEGACATAPVASEDATPSEEGGSVPSEPSASVDFSAADGSAAAEGKPAESEAASTSVPSATTESAENEPAGTERSAETVDAASAGPSSSDAARAPETFDGNNYLTNLKLSLRAGEISRVYELKPGETVDTRKDFPNGLPRSVKYSAELNIDTMAMLEAQGKYPFVTGDKVTVRCPI